MPFGIDDLLIGLAISSAVQGAGQLIGGVAGNIASQGDREKAQKAFEDAWKKINALGAGPDLSKKIFYEQFKSAGVLTPELEEAVDVGFSKVAQIKEDPRLKEAQFQTLRAIQERGKTGFTAEERAQLAQTRAEAERAAEAKRGQILAGLRARGAMDSGAGVAAQLGSAEELAARQLEAADRFSSAASQRALEAIMQGGQVAGGIRGQEFDIARTKAAAEDELQRFNVSQQIARQQRNIAAQNQAQQYNLAQQQQLMNMNVQQANAERLRQLQAQQQMYENQLHQAQLQAGMLGQQGQFYQQQAGQTQQGWQNIGGGLGQMAGAIGTAYMMSPSSTPAAASTATGMGYESANASNLSDWQADMNKLLSNPLYNPTH